MKKKTNKPIMKGTTESMEAGLNKVLEEGIREEERAERKHHDRPNMDEEAEISRENEEIGTIGTALPFQEGNFIPEMDE